MEEEYNKDVPIGFTRKSGVSKDLNPETFWSIYEDLLVITKCKQTNLHWGANAFSSV